MGVFRKGTYSLIPPHRDSRGYGTQRSGGARTHADTAGGAKERRAKRTSGAVPGTARGAVACRIAVLPRQNAIVSLMGGIGQMINRILGRRPAGSTPTPVIPGREHGS